MGFNALAVVILTISGIGRATGQNSHICWLAQERPRHLFILYFFSSITRHPSVDAGRDTSACKCLSIPFFLALSAFLLGQCGQLCRATRQLYALSGPVEREVGIADGWGRLAERRLLTG